MAILKAFKGLRPPAELAEKVASRPYDVLNSEEAAQDAEGNPYSLLHIIRPEIDLPEGTDIHSQPVYDKAVENFELFKKEGYLKADSEDHLYIYAQTMNGKTQYGLVGCAGVEDYMNGIIKKHELTRKDKEEDRMIHVRQTNANMEPVFFSYRNVEEIDKIIRTWVSDNKAIYNFTAVDGVGHKFWVIDDEETIEELVGLFEKEVPYTYVADGHHRTAAAALVGQEKKQQNPAHTGKEEYNFFLAVHFPDDQLNIIDYNRVVKDLNGMTAEAFTEKLEGLFEITEISELELKPAKRHEFSMYLEGKWYRMEAKSATFDDDDPIKGLDVTILSEHVLDNLLGIKDLRTDQRIDFVGGIRGLGELKKRVDSGEMKVAFALYPVSMDELINIADTGNIMPPKTTWFEPKLRSGLVVHSLED